MPIFPLPSSQSPLFNASGCTTFSRHRGGGEGGRGGNHHQYPSSSNKVVGGGITTSLNHSATTTVRQHQQDVPVVNVPEPNQFFVTPVATRLQLLGKLRLHSLIAYIEQLEAYRRAGLNHFKISVFNRHYYGMLMGKSFSATSSSASNGDKEDIEGEGAKMNAKVATLLDQVEAKLEALALKRMMAATVNSFGGHHSSNSNSHSNSSFNIENINNSSSDMMMSDYLQQLESGGGVVNHQDEEKVQKKKEEDEDEFIEVIDFTRLVDELVADGDVGVNEKKKIEDKEEEQLQSSSEDSKASFSAEEELIEELQEKLRLLEAEYKKAASEEEDSKKKKEKIVSKPSPSSSSSAAVVNKSEEFSTPLIVSPKPQLLLPDVDTKLVLGGYQLPLPKAFNRLALVEKNLLLAPLSERVRGHYLNMCWEEQLNEKLAQAQGLIGF